MSGKKHVTGVVVWLCITLALLVCGLLIGAPAVKHESIREAMKDAVLHGSNRISLFGIMDVNPALISAFTITGVILLISAVIRIFVIPKFQYVPGKFQLLLEQAVGFFDNLANQTLPIGTDSWGLMSLRRVSIFLSEHCLNCLDYRE